MRNKLFPAEENEFLQTRVNYMYMYCSNQTTPVQNCWCLAMLSKHLFDFHQALDV